MRSLSLFLFSPPMQSGKRLKESFRIFPLVCFFHCERGQFLFTAGRTIYCREVYSMHLFDFFFFSHPCNCGKWLHPLLSILTNPDFICVSAQKKKKKSPSQNPHPSPVLKDFFFFFPVVLFFPLFPNPTPPSSLPLSLVLLFYCFVQQSTITDPFQSTN